MSCRRIGYVGLLLLCECVCWLFLVARYRRRVFSFSTRRHVEVALMKVEWRGNSRLVDLRGGTALPIIANTNPNPNRSTSVDCTVKFVLPV